MALQFQTYSIVAGNAYCNASCFFCVSKMTTSPERALELAQQEIDWRNFHKASRLAQLAGVTTVLISGKGEPTMYPAEITAYLKALQEYGFPLIELQTNGTLFLNNKLYKDHDHLAEWYNLGLNTFIVSTVGVDSERNRRIYLPRSSEYPSLEKTVELLHDKGFLVRVGVVMLNGYVDSPAKVEEVVTYCRKHGIEQLTLRSVNKAENTKDPETNRQIAESQLTPKQLQAIVEHIEKNGTPLLNLVHNARVYDFRGQNLCLTDSLTKDAGSSELRSLIFYSTGEVTYDWQYSGAVILSKSPSARQKEKLLEERLSHISAEQLKLRR